MKRFLFVLLSCLFGFVPHLVFAEIIRSYDVEATVDTDRNLRVTETIQYDFEQELRHGIYRDIPVVYPRNGGTYKLRLDILSVMRDGKKEDFVKTTTGNNLRLKIGDKDKTITGSHTYTIIYQTNRAINDFPETKTQELYWNAIGNGWTIPIESAKFFITLPSDVSIESVSTTCFVGTYGSTEKSCSIVAPKTGKTFEIRSTRVLNAGEGLTAAIAVPEGTFNTIPFRVKLWQFIVDNGVIAIPLIAFCFMYFRWWTRGRDSKLAAVIPEYEAPKGYTPATVAASMTEGDIPDRAITATIIDLAERGYIHIRFGEQKGLLFGSTPTYTFVKTQKDPADLNEYEKDLYNGIFGSNTERTLEELKLPSNKFYQDIQNFKKKVQIEVDSKNLFDQNPGAVRGKYIIGAFAIGIVLFWTIGSMNLLGVICSIATGFMVAFFGWIMPRRNAAGSEFLRQAKGFEWFMSVTEKDRLDFHNAPERTPAQFMTLLPFAIALGVEKKWAAQFASLNMQSPNWAEGNTASHFAAASFVSNLGAMHTAAASSFSPPSSSGSGGSGFSGGGSGGGGGGGGGGSW
ncbi:DUF2207 domain-containing protein [Candidatus Uhrbacteria bacterium]|nr:DUF2207 domain-containing protein [Candidatus Uhrbacteria bacterium]